MKRSTEVYIKTKYQLLEALEDLADTIRADYQEENSYNIADLIDDVRHNIHHGSPKIIINREY